MGKKKGGKIRVSYLGVTNRRKGIRNGGERKGDFFLVIWWGVRNLAESGQGFLLRMKK